MCLPPSTPPPSSRTVLFFLSYPPIHLLVFIHFITPVSGNLAFCVLNLYGLREGCTKCYHLFLFTYLFIYSLFDDVLRACNLRWGVLWYITVK